MPVHRALQVVLLCTLVAASVPGLSADRGPETTGPGDKRAAKADAAGGKLAFQYGFRYDPMKWVQNDGSLQAALVRTIIFKRPRPWDRRLIEMEIQKLFAKLAPGGEPEGLDALGRIGARGDTLVRLLEIGCSLERREMRRAIAAMRDEIDGLAADQQGGVPRRALQALGMLGMMDQPAFQASIPRMGRMEAEGMDHAFGPGLPRTPDVELMTLWACRKGVADVEAVIERGLKWIDKNIEPTSCSSRLGLCPAANLITQIAAKIDHPVAARIATKLVPTILRRQEPDGGWGRLSFSVFRALTMHGLLEELRKRPALPADWRVVRAIPAPGRDPINVVWDGRKLWVHDRGSGSAIAVSPENGKVLKRTDLPELPGLFTIGVWGKSLALTIGGDDRALFKIDPETGEILQEVSLDFMPDQVGSMIEVRGQILVSDIWDGHVWVIDPDGPGEPRRIRTALGCPSFMTGHGDDIWAVEMDAPVIIRTNMKGQLLDWGERPFGWVGIAWDGKNLWALDHANRRLCIIEKSNATQWVPKAPPAYVRRWLVCGPFPSEPLPPEELARIARERPDDLQVELLRTGHHIDYLKAAGGEAATRPRAGQVVRGPDGTTVRWRRYNSDIDAVYVARAFPRQDVSNHAAYGCTTMNCAEPVKGFLSIGHIGSIKVYFNGRLVLDEHRAGFARRETLLIPVTFQKGKNTVLVKLDNDLGNGAFILRAVTVDPRTLERRALTPAAP